MASFPRRIFLRGAAPWATALALLPRLARAEEPGLELRLVAPALAAGDRKAVRAELLLPAGAIGPVMLTPTAEGTAVEVVRGRLTTDDAEAFTSGDGRAGLRFAIPVACHTPGTSVLRVRADAYACAATCSALEASARLEIRVQRAPT